MIVVSLDFWDTFTLLCMRLREIWKSRANPKSGDVYFFHLNINWAVEWMYFLIDIIWFICLDFFLVYETFHGAPWLCRFRRFLFPVTFAGNLALEQMGDVWLGICHKSCVNSSPLQSYINSSPLPALFRWEKAWVRLICVPEFIVNIVVKLKF